MKTKLILIKLSFIFLLLFSFNGWSQNIIGANELNQNWILIDENNGVQLFVQLQDCKIEPFDMPLTYAFMKIENSTTSDRDVYFQLGLIFDEECSGCGEQPESKRAINIKANSSREGNCDFKNTELSYLIVNPNFKDTRIFNGLQLIDFKTN